jgi:hypothetical protein
MPAASGPLFCPVIVVWGRSDGAWRRTCAFGPFATRCMPLRYASCFMLGSSTSKLSAALSGERAASHNCFICCCSDECSLRTGIKHDRLTFSACMRRTNCWRSEPEPPSSIPRREKEWNLELLATSKKFSDLSALPSAPPPAHACSSSSPASIPSAMAV